MSGPGEGPRVLVVGGLGGLLGRALATELVAGHRVRSFHRHRLEEEARLGVEWVEGDVAGPTDWSGLLDGVDAVVNLAWYRWGSAARFRGLRTGLVGLLNEARAHGIGRFIQVSVPGAPPALESRLPYLREKRAVDDAVARSGISYRILRPTAMFGERDVLLGVMIRAIHRYPFFPMFGDGEYHLSPIAAADVARAITRELARDAVGTDDLGGPRCFTYRELTDLMYALLGKRPRYWRMSPRNGHRLAAILQTLGSSLLYAYEVDWLVADRLGLPPYSGLDRPLRSCEPYLRARADALRLPPAPRRSPPGRQG